MVGLLVCGDNHFIVRGPEPDDRVARALVRQWSVITIGQTTPASLSAWRISTRENRQDLGWAVVVASLETAHSPAITQLLSELEIRGIAVRHI